MHRFYCLLVVNKAQNFSSLSRCPEYVPYEAVMQMHRLFFRVRQVDGSRVILIAVAYPVHDTTVDQGGSRERRCLS